MYSIFSDLLQRNNVKAAEVAKATGISTGSLSDWKHGRSNPKQEKLQKIADYFGVSVDYLMGRETNEDGRTIITEDEASRLQVLKVNDKLRILFDKSQGLKPSDIDFVLEMVEKLRNR